MKGQIPVQEFIKYTGEDGLPQLHFFEIWQDSTGYMWAATKGGLSRFDGSDFKTYQYSASDSSSLNDNFVNGIVKLTGDRFYALTPKGLNLYIPEKDTFQRFNFNGETLPDFGEGGIRPQTDHLGDIWFSAFNGLFKFDTHKNKLEKIELPVGEKEAASFHHFTLSPDKTALWVHYRPNVLFYWNLKNKEKQTYFLKGLHEKEYACWLEASPDRPQLYLLTRNFNGTSDSVRLLTFDYQKQHLSIRHSERAYDRNGKTLPARLADHPDGDGVLFFSDQKLLSVPFDTKKNVTTYLDLGAQQFSAEAPTAFSRDEVFWFGSTGQGLYSMHLPTAGQFQEVGFGSHTPLGTASIRSIFRGSEGKIWVGGYSGLASYDPTTGQTEHVLDRHISYDWNAFSIVPDPVQPEKYLWFSSECCQLHKFDLETKQAFVAPNESFLPINKANNMYQLLSDTAHQCIWAGTNEGLVQFDPISENFLTFPLKWKGHKAKAISLNFSEDNRGIWVGSNLGVFFFDIKKKQCSRFFGKQAYGKGLNQSSVYSCLQKGDTLWVGTLGGGLNCIDLATGQAQYFTTQQGLPDNVVYGVLADEMGNLWMSTNRGISQFDPKTNVFTNYNQSDGLQDNEFNAFAYYQDQEGSFYFGGIKGANVFVPTAIQKNQYVSPVKIEEVFSLTNNAPLPISKETPSITVPFNHTILRISFAALSYDMPSHNQFAYLLDGVHQSWIELGNKNQVIITNLDPGEYTLRIKSANKAGVWHDTGSTLKINVLPPFYYTYPFILSVLLLIAGVLYGGIGWRNVQQRKDQIELEELVVKRSERLQEQNKELSQQKEELTLAIDRQKRLQTFKDLFVGTLVHDLKNPLNTIIAKAKIPENREAGERMLQLVSNILDGQKLEQASMPVNLTETNLEELILAVLKMTKHLAIRKSLQVKFERKFHYLVSADAELLVRVLENLMTNAIKYSPIGGGILIRCTHQEEMAIIEMEDQGPGIPDELIEQLFEKYQQANSKKLGHARSTGIGLMFCKRAMKALNGEITVTSPQGKGAAFLLKVPLFAQLPLSESSPDVPRKYRSHKAHIPGWDINDHLIIIPYIAELQRLEIYHYSKIASVLNKMTAQKSSPQVEVWKSEILEAVKSFNHQKYYEMLDL